MEFNHRGPSHLVRKPLYNTRIPPSTSRLKGLNNIKTQTPLIGKCNNSPDTGPVHTPHTDTSCLLSTFIDSLSLLSTITIYTHTHLHIITLTHKQTNNLSLSFALSLCLSLSLSLFLSLSQTHKHSLSLYPSITHTHIAIHTHKHLFTSAIKDDRLGIWLISIL